MVILAHISRWIQLRMLCLSVAHLKPSHCFSTCLPGAFHEEQTIPGSLPFVSLSSAGLQQHLQVGLDPSSSHGHACLPPACLFFPITTSPPWFSGASFPLGIQLRLKTSDNREVLDPNFVPFQLASQSLSKRNFERESVGFLLQENDTNPQQLHLLQVKPFVQQHHHRVFQGHVLHRKTQKHVKNVTVQIPSISWKEWCGTTPHRKGVGSRRTFTSKSNNACMDPNDVSSKFLDLANGVDLVHGTWIPPAENT